MFATVKKMKYVGMYASDYSQERLKVEWQAIAEGVVISCDVFPDRIVTVHLVQEAMQH